jgi:hypothetical protein
VYSQVLIRLNLSQNFFNINYGKDSDYFYGGTGNSSISGALDLEFRLKDRKSKKDTVVTLRKMMLTKYRSILVAAHYSNHDFSVSGFSANGDPILSYMNTQFIHMPIMFKINFQPFVLDEGFIVGAGIGVVPSYLINGSLHEEATIITRDSNGDVINEEFISDETDITLYHDRFFLMFGIELSWSIGRIYVAQRVWFSVRDVYMAELANNWAVPTTHSVYFGAYETWPGIDIGGGAFVIGIKLY